MVSLIVSTGNTLYNLVTGSTIDWRITPLSDRPYVQKWGVGGYINNRLHATLPPICNLTDYLQLWYGL